MHERGLRALSWHGDDETLAVHVKQDIGKSSRQPGHSLLELGLTRSIAHRPPNAGNACNRFASRRLSTMDAVYMKPRHQRLALVDEC